MSETKLIFTGESHYQVHEALDFRKKGFVSKHWSEWLHIFRHDELDLDMVQSCVMWWWFFAAKSLTIIYGLPRDNTSTNKVKASDAEHIESFLMESRDHIPSDNVVILVSYKPDKRMKSWKFFSKAATIKEFKPKKGKDLTLFVVQKLWSLITNTQAEYIVSLVGNNLYNLSYEAQKLNLYAEYHALEKLTNDHISQVAYAQWEGDNFKILDKIFTDPSKAITLIDEAKHEWTDMFLFTGMLYRWLKLIIGMLDLDAAGVKSSKDMSSTLKLHPFAVAKQHSKIATFRAQQDKIKDFYRALLQLDRDIKTGNYPADAYWVKIKSLVNRFK